MVITGSPRKRFAPKGARGFESHPHRQKGFCGTNMLKSVTKKLVFIFLLAFVLNLVWENLHAVLYYLPSGGPITQGMLFRATLIDAIFITLLSLPFIFLAWFSRRVWLVIPVGIFVAITIEFRALFSNRWAYTEAMPIIPFLDIGVTPTIQLGSLAYLIYKIVHASHLRDK